MTKQEIWIRRNNGEEAAIQLSGVDVPVREGQRLTFIAAKHPRAKDGFWVTVVNHTANRHWRLLGNAEISVQGRLGVFPLVRLFDFVVAAAIFFAMVVEAFLGWGGRPPVDLDLADLAPFHLSVLFLIPLFYVPFQVARRMKLRNRIFAALDTWAEQNAKEAYRMDNEETAAVSAERVA
jgi:hypothetical protein